MGKKMSALGIVSGGCGQAVRKLPGLRELDACGSVDPERYWLAEHPIDAMRSGVTLSVYVSGLTQQCARFGNVARLSR